MTREYHNILIRMPNWIGDAIMATPIIEDVRKKWPDANLTAMCQGDAISMLLCGNPYLDEIFTFSKGNSFLRKQDNRDVIERLFQGRYDLGILLSNSFSSAWLLWRGKIKTRIGFASDMRRLLLSQALVKPKKTEEHLVTTYKRLLIPLGIPISSHQPALYVTQEERDAAKKLLAQYKIPENATIVGINAGAAYGSAKCWLPERFRKVIEKLIQRPKTYVLCFGDLSGQQTVHQICEGMPPSVINLAAATTLRELIALIEQCSVFLTNDSGPMHIAAALHTPLVALFGSTSEIATGPYHHGRVIHKHVECSPCFRRVCPIDFRCMKKIEVDEVYSSLIEELNDKLIFF